MNRDGDAALCQITLITCYNNCNAQLKHAQKLSGSQLHLLQHSFTAVEIKNSSHKNEGKCPEVKMHLSNSFTFSLQCYDAVAW